MRITIDLDTSTPGGQLSDGDRHILRALAGDANPSAPAVAKAPKTDKAPAATAARPTAAEVGGPGIDLSTPAAVLAATEPAPAAPAAVQTNADPDPQGTFHNWIRELPTKAGVTQDAVKAAWMASKDGAPMPKQVPASKIPQVQAAMRAALGLDANDAKIAK